MLLYYVVLEALPSAVVLLALGEQVMIPLTPSV